MNPYTRRCNLCEMFTYGCKYTKTTTYYVTCDIQQGIKIPKDENEEVGYQFLNINPKRPIRFD